MNWDAAADLAGAILLLVGSFLCLSAAVGLVRFNDILTRMHAATKPQSLGLVVIVLGVAVSLRDVRALGVLLLVATLQLMTSPVSAHMVARTAYRSHQISNGAIVADELAEDLAAAGFELTSSSERPEVTVQVPDAPTGAQSVSEDSPDETSDSDLDEEASDGPEIRVPDYDPGEGPGEPASPVPDQDPGEGPDGPSFQVPDHDPGDEPDSSR